MKSNYELSVLLICEGGRWVAQCLEYDFTAQGKSMNKAMDSFAKSFAGQVFMDVQHGKEPLEDFTKAPVEYWDIFHKASKLQDRTAIRVPEQFIPGGVGLAQAAVFA